MRFLKTNTATRVTVGPFLDKTDGITPETALTVTNEKLTFMVDDAGVPTLVLDTAPTASGGSNDMVHVTNDDAGFYDLELAAANVNYVGRAMLALTDAANHCPVFHEFMILSAQAYDALCGTGNFSANVIAISGDTDAADNCELMFDGTGYAGGTTKLGVDAVAISGDSGAADNLEAAYDGAGYAGGTIKPKVDLDTIKTQTVTCGAGVTVLASVGTAATSTAQTGDTYALANGATGFVAIKGDTAAILADTGTDGVVVAAASKTGYSLTATTGLGNQTANITGNLSGSVGSVTGAVGSVTGAVGSVTGAVGSVTGNVGGNVVGSVASVTGNVGGNVVGSVASVTAGVTLANGAHGGAAATITAKSIAVTNSDAGGIAVDLVGSGTGNSHALRLQSTNGKALAAGSTNSDAITVDSGAAKGLVVNGATADIDANITGNISGSVGSVTVVSAGAIANTSFAAGAVDADACAANFLGASELASDACNEIADAILARDIAGGASTSDAGSPSTARTVRSALRAVRNKAAIAAGTLTVYKENDTDAAWTATVATTAGDPISSVDPG